MLSEMKQPDFVDLLKYFEVSPIKPIDIGILQINVGKLCNNICSHCHVDAGPKRTEIMGKEVMEYALKALENPSIHTIDITGGAPEMNPNIEWFINKLAEFDKKLIVRTNLNILLDPKFKKYMDIYKTNQVVLIASMPCYTLENVDAQRGDGVYNKCVEILKQLNKIGYGIEDTGLELNLVYNPGGIGLPGPQDGLEKDYKRELWDRHKIKFNQLYTITNIPIGRFLSYLHDTGQKEEYMRKLIDAFNPEAALGIMCRDTISLSWDGYIYDCDFNQMLDLKIRGQDGKPVRIQDFDAKNLKNRSITFKNHCYGCCQGAGSSCQGALL
jgi:radical SAM/Cys-rich protein